MNIALEKTEEYVNGAKRREYGDAFVRGNNGEASLVRPVADGSADGFPSHVHFCRLVSAGLSKRQKSRSLFPFVIGLMPCRSLAGHGSTTLSFPFFRRLR